MRAQRLVSLLFLACIGLASRAHAGVPIGPPAPVEESRVVAFEAAQLVVLADDGDRVLLLVDRELRVVEVLDAPNGGAIGPRIRETHVRAVALTFGTHAKRLLPLAAEPHRACTVVAVIFTEACGVYAYASGDPVSRTDPMGLFDQGTMEAIYRAKYGEGAWSLYQYSKSSITYGQESFVLDPWGMDSSDINKGGTEIILNKDLTEEAAADELFKDLTSAELQMGTLSGFRYLGKSDDEMIDLISKERAQAVKTTAEIAGAATLGLYGIYSGEGGALAFVVSDLSSGTFGWSTLLNAIPGLARAKKLLFFGKGGKPLAEVSGDIASLSKGGSKGLEIGGGRFPTGKGTPTPEGWVSVNRVVTDAAPDVKGLAEALPFASEAFPSVRFANLAQSDITLRGLGEARRVLKAGGMVIVQTGTASDVQAVEGLMKQAGFTKVFWDQSVAGRIVITGVK